MFEKFVKSGSEFLEEAKSSLEWLGYLGVSHPASRYWQYIKKMQDFGVGVADEYLERYVCDFLNSYSELLEIIKLKKAFESIDSADYVESLRKVTSGQFYRNRADQDPSRDYLFELSMAARILRSGYAIELNNIADIVATIEGRRIYIEAKRVKSLQQLGKRISYANDQIKKRLAQDCSSKSRGFIAVDLTDLVNPKTQMAIASRSDSIVNMHVNDHSQFVRGNMKSLHKGKQSRTIGVFSVSSFCGASQSSEINPAELISCRFSMFVPYDSQNATNHYYANEVFSRFSNQDF